MDGERTPEQPMSEVEASDERERMISRIVEGRARGDDWERLRTVSAEDPTVWRDLADTQEVQRALAAQVEAVVEAAGGVEAPVGAIARVRAQGRLRLAGVWGGWAAAAALTVAWALGPAGRPVERAGTQAGDVFPVGYRPPTTPDEALDQYLEMGRRTGVVAGTQPGLVVRSIRPIIDERGSRFEVVYVRQILERAEVTALRQVQGAEFDESGRPVGLQFELIRPALGR